MDKYSDENILDIPDEKYEIKTNVSMNLSKELGLPIFTYINTNDWKPPETHGLENCNQIIPYYYVSQKNVLI